MCDTDKQVLNNVIITLNTSLRGFNMIVSFIVALKVHFVLNKNNKIV